MIKYEPTQQSMEIGFLLWEQYRFSGKHNWFSRKPSLDMPSPSSGRGEFLPRRFLHRYTKFPVVVPSATPANDATYTSKYMIEQSQVQVARRIGIFLDGLANGMIKGYCINL